ncbi:MAG: 7-carboxy-7-deazaguanine synthase (Cx14CxxC type) [Sphingomonas echinoides]|jgi:7-carboxy-7-deazaguanine synthase (Cx14CxxC type)
MSYAVKEIFKTLQGEGAQSGRAAVFCRFAGCNLWSGREADRVTSVCSFCDTDFVGMDGTGGGRFTDAEALASAIEAEWAGSSFKRYVVLTGGEPLLQVDAALVDALHARGFEIGVETNGTQPAPDGLDWICVSPKADAELVLREGDELKLVYPQEKALPDRFEHLAFEHFFLQPMDSPTAAANLEAAITYCTDNPRWRLSLQSHKMIGIR